MHRIVLCLTLSLAGCAQQVAVTAVPQDTSIAKSIAARVFAPQVPAQTFGAVAPVPDMQDLLQLSAEQQQDFLSYFHHPRYADQTPEYRLYSYMQNVLAVFQFSGNTTPASEVMRSGTAGRRF